jgi:hypothetical protein
VQVADADAPKRRVRRLATVVPDRRGAAAHLGERPRDRRRLRDALVERSQAVVDAGVGVPALGRIAT